jgi:hypothetical protein
MFQFIQSLPENPIFVLILLAVAIYLWFHMPKTEWWKKHICADFADSGHHPACFMCNEGNEICYNDLNRCAAYRQQLAEIYKKE